MVLLQDAPYDVVLLDIWLPDRDGLDVLADMHQLAVEMRPEVVIISGHGTIEAAVKATSWAHTTFWKSRSRSIAR